MGVVSIWVVLINGCGQYMGSIDLMGVVSIWVVLINGCGQYMGRIDQGVWPVHGWY